MKGLHQVFGSDRSGQTSSALKELQAASPEVFAGMSVPCFGGRFPANPGGLGESKSNKNHTTASEASHAEAWISNIFAP